MYVTVPEGFVTDLASIPRILWPLLPKTGSYVEAAIVHDWLYWDGAMEGQPIPRRVADRVFYRLMRQAGTSPLVAGLVWVGVRLGGWLAWSRHRRRD